jgi:hypothetical protein
MRTDPKGSDDMGRVLRHAVLGYSRAMGLSKARDNLMTRNVCPVACGLVTWELTLHNKIRLSTPVAARTGTGRLSRRLTRRLFHSQAEARRLSCGNEDAYLGILQSNASATQ